ncbi:MAG: M13 family metallopeptidase [Balneolaceae bacterium]|jgi:putative endopeptidase
MKNLFSAIIVAISAVSMLAGCSSQLQNQHPLDLSGVDSTANPTDNFFEYANGNWIKNTEIPASQRGWGSFYVVRDNALSNMKTILDSAASLENPSKGSVEQQIGDLYKSGMDSASIEEAGLKPLQESLDHIAAISSGQDVFTEVIREYKSGNGTLFRFHVDPDDKNSRIERAHFDQGGLGLPNRDYYFKKDDKSQKIREAYRDYVSKILTLSGTDEDAANGDAKAVIELETKLAKASKAPVELRDPEANYHLLSLNDFNEMTPNINWNNVISAMELGVDTLQVGQPEFYKQVSELIEATPVSVWKDYLRFHMVSGNAQWLSSPFAEAHFNFYNRLLNGQKEPQERWKRISNLVNHTLGDALGQLYVERYFPPEAKEYMVGMVDNLQQTYRERIKNLDWMSDSTKTKALEKLNAFVKKIGYPDKWEDYSSIEIDSTSLLRNLMSYGRWHYRDMVDKLGKPVDRTEWGMTAPTVNAYYNPSFNEIVFPAGILQPPFYYQGADDAVNYGAIGAVIGHEMTHGFDDQGSQYDKYGNLNSWWTKKDRTRFEKLTQQVVDQYNSYTVLDTVHVNGKLTLGENIADIGGLAIAHAAFEKTDQAKSNKKINGLTPEQRFFMAFAQVWRIKNTPEWLQWRINNDPHSPEKYRVIGPTSNMVSFYQAYGVEPGDGMYRPDSIRVRIW